LSSIAPDRVRPVGRDDASQCAGRRRRLRLLRQPQSVVLGVSSARPVRHRRHARALTLTSPQTGERDVCLGMLARLERREPITVIGDKGYAGRDFQTHAAALGARIIRPRRKDEPGPGPHLAPIRQRVESIFWTAKDMLCLEDHRARELHTLRARRKRTSSCSQTRRANARRPCGWRYLNDVQHHRGVQHSVVARPGSARHHQASDNHGGSRALAKSRCTLVGGFAARWSTHCLVAARAGRPAGILRGCRARCPFPQQARGGGVR